MNRFDSDISSSPDEGRLRQLRRRLFSPQTGDRLRDTTAFAVSAHPGPLVDEVFAKIQSIPGWFTIDDCAHFHLVLSLQTALGMQGDIFEIGSYFGRSTAMLAYELQPGEKLVVCDAFTEEIDDAYPEQPTAEAVKDAIKRVRPDCSEDAVEIHACLSRDLALPVQSRFRFIHIDGGHSQGDTLHDLHLSAGHIMSHGIIVVDDYHNDQWPGVTHAVDRFLGDQDQFSVLADLNRFASAGRKLYLINNLGNSE